MTESQIAKTKGIRVLICGTEYTVPPLSLGAIEQLQDGLATFTGDIRDPKQVALIVDAAHAALRRNYPNLTRDEVADMVDLENMKDIMEAVMDISGLKRKEKEKAEGGGEPGKSPPAD